MFQKHFVSWITQILTAGLLGRLIEKIFNAPLCFIQYGAYKRATQAKVNRVTKARYKNVSKLF